MQPKPVIYFPIRTCFCFAVFGVEVLPCTLHRLISSTAVTVRVFVLTEAGTPHFHSKSTDRHVQGRRGGVQDDQQDGILRLNVGQRFATSGRIYEIALAKGKSDSCTTEELNFIFGNVSYYIRKKKDKQDKTNPTCICSKAVTTS